MGRLIHTMRMPHWFLIVGWLALAGCQGGALEYDDPGKTGALPGGELSASGEPDTMPEDVPAEEIPGRTSTLGDEPLTMPSEPDAPSETGGAGTSTASVESTETATGEGASAAATPPPLQPPLDRAVPPAGIPSDAERAAPGESDEAFRRRQALEKSLDTSTALTARRRETLAAGATDAGRTREQTVAGSTATGDKGYTRPDAAASAVPVTGAPAMPAEAPITSIPADSTERTLSDRPSNVTGGDVSTAADTTRPEPGAARTTDDTARTDETGAAATRGGVSTSGATTTRDATTDTTDTTRATDTATEPISDTTTARTVETERSAETTTAREAQADTARGADAGAPEGTRDATTSDTTATATARDIVSTEAATGTREAVSNDATVGTRETTADAGQATTTARLPEPVIEQPVATADRPTEPIAEPAPSTTDGRTADSSTGTEDTHIPTTDTIRDAGVTTADSGDATRAGSDAGGASAWDLLTHAGTSVATHDTATGDETASHADTTVTPDASHPDTVTAETRDTGATATHDTAATTTHPEAVTAAASHPTTVASLPRDGSVPADSTAHSTDPSTTVSHDVPALTVDQHATPDGSAEAAVTAHPETTTSTLHDGTADTVTAGHPSTLAQQETHATSTTAAHDDAITTTHPETVTTATTHPAATAIPDAHPESTATVELHPTDVTEATHPAGTTESALPHDTVAKTATPHETDATTETHGATDSTPADSLTAHPTVAAIDTHAEAPVTSVPGESGTAHPETTITTHATDTTVASHPTTVTDTQTADTHTTDITAATTDTHADMPVATQPVTTTPDTHAATTTTTEAHPESVTIAEPHPAGVSTAATHPAGTTESALPHDTVAKTAAPHETDIATDIHGTIGSAVPVTSAPVEPGAAHPEATIATHAADTTVASHPTTVTDTQTADTHTTDIAAATTDTHADTPIAAHPVTTTPDTHAAATTTTDAHPEPTATVELHPAGVSTAASHPAGTPESALPHDTTADTSHPVASLDPSVFEAAVTKQAIIPAPQPDAHPESTAAPQPGPALAAEPAPEPAAPKITITPKNFTAGQVLELPIDSVDKDFVYIKASAGPDYSSELGTGTTNPQVIVQSDTPPEVTLECKDFQYGPMVAQQEVVQFAGAYAVLAKFRYPRVSLKGNQPGIIAAAPQCTLIATADGETASLPIVLRLRGRPPVIYGKNGLLETTMDAKMHTHVTLYIHKLWGDVAQASASKESLVDPVFKVTDWNLDVVQDPVYTSCTPAQADKSTLNGIAGSFGEYKIIPVYSVEQIKPQNNTTHDCIVMVKDKQQNTGTLHLTLQWVINEPAATGQTAESSSGDAAQDVSPKYWNPPQTIEPVNFAVGDTLWLAGDVNAGWQSKLDGAIDDLGTRPMVRVTGSPNAPMYQLDCVSGLYPPFAGKFIKLPTPTESVGDYYLVDLSYDFSTVQAKSLLTYYYCTAKAYNGVDPDKTLGMHFEIAPHMLVAGPEMDTTPNEGKTSDSMGGFFDLDVP